ncbi:hypothetical protein BS50DRAFT_184227 [Corynespora cassiicola Philippines]|uniref:Uncharacterized protein n=1 Tax=Corynespora cassiicola Philippines TaxID=1448308 RepID=A0A2T2P6Q4_CORCC|nr:hypothetical protein BS50DRAFT_184227 [Corynespora cassiicola Philippines]
MDPRRARSASCCLESGGGLAGWLAGASASTRVGGSPGWWVVCGAVWSVDDCAHCCATGGGGGGGGGGGDGRDSLIWGLAPAYLRPLVRPSARVTGVDVADIGEGRESRGPPLLPPSLPSFGLRVRYAVLYGVAMCCVVWCAVRACVCACVRYGAVQCNVPSRTFARAFVALGRSNGNSHAAWLACLLACMHALYRHSACISINWMSNHIGAKAPSHVQSAFSSCDPIAILS